MIVISDVSPIMNLALIARLDVLGRLFGEILIPPAVYAELTWPHAGSPLLSDTSDWLVVTSPGDQGRVKELLRELDRGEAEAIVLALERRADLVLVDERRARRTAVSLGLRIIGLLGIPVAAKRSGLIREVKPLLDEPIQCAGFWVGADVHRKVLREAGEP